MTISEINETLDEIMSGIKNQSMSAAGSALDIYGVGWPRQESVFLSGFTSFVSVAFYVNVNRNRKAFARVMITAPDGSGDLYDFNSIESDLMRLTDEHDVDLLVEKYVDLLLTHNPVLSVTKPLTETTILSYLNDVLFSGVMLPGEPSNMTHVTKIRSLGVKTMLELQAEYFAALIIKSFVKMYTMHIGTIPDLVKPADMGV